MGEQYQAIVDEDAEALVIAASSEAGARLKEELNLPFPVLIDLDGSTHRRFGAVDKGGQPTTAVYVTDRFGEVFAAHHTSEGERLPLLSEIITTLEFVSIQCPECAQPEWPI
jgi:peroxiredoxin